MNFLRQSHIKSVSLDRISRDETPPEELWTPYPMQSAPRPSHMSWYFDEACKLSFIARDASWDISRTYKDVGIKQELYDRLCKWERELPKVFDPKEMPAPYIIILRYVMALSLTASRLIWINGEYLTRMRYHTLVINLCCHDLPNDMSFTRANEHDPGSASSNNDFDAIKTALSSARAIASLVRKYGTEYGLEHSHQFAMYAINVSLFCLLAQEDFAILDPDFLSLTQAFSIVACRSQVGRHLFRAFKISVRSRNQAGLMKSPDDVPPAIRELLGPCENYSEPDKWDRYAEYLAEVDGEGSYLKDIGMDPTVPGLHEMLKWYESLSIGRAVPWKRGREPAF